MSKEIDTRVQENLKTLENMIWSRPICTLYVSAGAVPALVRLLSSRKDVEAERAARTLWNIAAGDDACKAACVSAGAVPALVRLLSSSKGVEVERAAGALWIIALGEAACKAACVEAGAVPMLTRLLSSSKGYEAERAAGALWSIVASDAACAAACVEAGAVPVLVKLMSLTNYSGPRIILNYIANHSPEYKQLVINAGFNPR